MSLNYSRTYNQKIYDWIVQVKKKAQVLSERSDLENKSCPHCGHHQNKFFVNNGSLTYVQCNDCDLVFMNPRPSSASVNDGFRGEDELLMSYFQIIIDQKNSSETISTSSGDQSKMQAVDPLKDLQLKDIYSLKPKGRLLDLGCSVGRFLEKAQAFYDVEGIEINPITAIEAQKKFKVHTDFLENLKLDPVYDIVTLHQILYGVPDNVSLLKSIHKILKSDGLLYINTPNSDSIAVQTFQGLANHFYGYSTLNVYNHRSLQRLCELSGFRIKTFRTEWLDVYPYDLLKFKQDAKNFIHKRNIQYPDYEKHIKDFDMYMQSTNIDLGNHGNYIVAVLEKI